MLARNNPFATCYLESMPYVFTAQDKKRFITNVVNAKYYGSIIGPEGTGKSKILELLQVELPLLGKQIKHIKLTDEKTSRQLLQLFSYLIFGSSKTLLLLDSAGLIPASIQKPLFYLLKRRGNIILTAHTKLDMPCLLETKPEFEVFRNFVTGLTNNPDLQALDTLTDIFNRNAGNMRTSFLELYDRAVQVSYGSAAL